MLPLMSVLTQSTAEHVAFFLHRFSIIVFCYNQLMFVTSYWKFAYLGQSIFWAKMPWNESGPIKRHPLSNIKLINLR